VWKDRFPRTIDFLSASGPGGFFDQTVKTARVWDAFREVSKLSQIEAEGVVRFAESKGAANAPPLLWFTDLGGLGGLFDPGQPARISIHSDIAQQFEGRSADLEAQTYLQCKILHEMVHWALCKQDLSEADEMGVVFETKAYSTMPTPFWLPPNDVPPPQSRPDKLDHGQANMIKLGGTEGPLIGAGSPRGIRNNNPGNIRRSTDQWQGLASLAEMTAFQREETAFFVFRSALYGLRAIASILTTYEQKYKLATVDAMINRWAPPNENKTNAYADAVSAAMKIGKTESFKFSDPARGVPMMTAIVRQENGVQPYSEALITQAHGMGIA
jgi:hypothetical protein